MPSLIGPKRLLCFQSHFPAPSTSSSLFARSGPEDFWLFGYLKGVLQGNSFDESEEFDELLSGIEKILRGISPETLASVFQEWITRLRKSIDVNGEYVD
jgi:hypothetical protein